MMAGDVTAQIHNGNLIINPATGTLVENPNQTDIGDPNPKAILGLNNTLTYKGFTLYFQFDAHIGGSIFTLLKEEAADSTRFDDWTRVLLDQATLAEGGQLANPAAFVRRVNALLAAGA